MNEKYRLGFLNVSSTCSSSCEVRAGDYIAGCGCSRFYWIQHRVSVFVQKNALPRREHKRRTRKTSTQRIRGHIDPKPTTKEQEYIRQKRSLQTA